MIFFSFRLTAAGWNITVCILEALYPLSLSASPLLGIFGRGSIRPGLLWFGVIRVPVRGFSTLLLYGLVSVCVHWECPSFYFFCSGIFFSSPIMIHLPSAPLGIFFGAAGVGTGVYYTRLLFPLP